MYIQKIERRACSTVCKKGLSHETIHITVNSGQVSTQKITVKLREEKEERGGGLWPLWACISDAGAQRRNGEQTSYQNHLPL